MKDPTVSVSAFAHAINNVDEAAAESLCTLAGWMAPGDGPLKLYRQAVKKRLLLEVAGEAMMSGRQAAVPMALIREGGKQELYLLLLLEEAWRIEGLCHSPAQAELFVAGRIPALFSWAGLPGDEGLAGLVAGLCAEEIDPDAVVSSELPQDQVQLRLVIRRTQQESREPEAEPLTAPEVRVLEASGRAVVTIRPDVHLYFERGAPGWVFLRAGALRTVEELLRRSDEKEAGQASS